MFALAATALAAGPGAAATSEPVKIDTGLLQGVAGRDAAITVYKGIPYAAPPVGDLRWKPPAPAGAWQGVRKADQFGATCPSPEGGPNAAAAMSEDCLFANVWTGAKSSAERRPVFVWIYGGGFSSGAGSQPDFDGEGLAKKGVVVVTFNYRLGALGFLATPELSKESGHGASGNYGLMDDVALLKWVQKNIAAFGGDPNRVTIAGQSAGAGSVGFMSMSPLAKGLFRQGIGESHARHPGDLELRYLSVSLRESLKTAEQQGQQYAEAHGAKTLKELRALPWQEVIKGSSTFDPSVDTGSTAEPPLFRPVVDGWVLPHNYSQTYKLGAQNDVGYVAGNNKDETGAVPETAIAGLRARPPQARAGSAQINVTLAAYVAGAKRKFGPMADEFLKLYPAANDDEAALQNNAAARDNNRVATYLWGIEWTRHANKPVYTYFWTHAPPGPGHDQRGAYHGSEINYVFGNLYAIDRPWTDEDRRIADTMSSYWANIIAKGDPNGPGLPAWPKYDPKSPTVMELGDRFGVIPVAEPARIDFWRRFFLSHDQW
jgi:para-nitrobenzyl esterase